MLAKIFKRLEIEITRVNYAYERYKLESTFTLIHHEKPLSPQDLGNFIRITDKFVQVDEHTYFLIFVFTPEETAFKASQNLLFNLDKFFNSTDTHIAISSFDTSKTPSMLINKLTQILQESRKSSYARIEDENILNRF
ncbi:hypothetical protein KKA17_02030 [bacterium]|nr:hypothetical protein [bacterium]MBU1884008.1 hypothetical protein [bacterium]